ncbi:MAG TPA: hypothetical protein VGN37_03685 [Actinocatenispora sp.]
MITPARALAAVAVALLTATPAYAGTAPAGALLTVVSAGPLAPSALVSTDPGTGAATSRRLPYTLTVAGYDAPRRRLFGLATAARGRPLPDGAHVVAVDDGGASRDLGPVPAWLAGARAGDVVAGHLVVLVGAALATVAVAPRPHVLRVRTVGVLPFGDLAADGIGGLYGVGPVGTLTHLDPDTGAVRRTRVPGLPAGYADALAPTGPNTLYAWLRGPGLRRTLWRIPLRGNGSARRVGTALAAFDADGAWRPGAVTPPPRHPTPTPTPAHTVPATTPAPPQPRPSAPPGRTPVRTPPASPSRSPSSHPAVPAPSVTPPHHHRYASAEPVAYRPALGPARRRWMLNSLALLTIASVLAARARRIRAARR